MLEGRLAERREAVQLASSDEVVVEHEEVGDKPVTCVDAAVAFLREVLPEQYGEMTAEEVAALTSLDLEGATITDADLAHLAAMPALETLGLEGTAVTDGGLAYLWALPQLKSLDLRRTGITGAGLWQCPAHALEALHLTDTRVSASDLQRLPPMPRLRTLKLNGLDFGDQGIADLVHLPSVQHLELDRTAITDVGLRTLLNQNPALTRIELRDTGVTQEGIAALQLQHPSVELAWEAVSATAYW
jgi:hypothetical protein